MQFLKLSALLSLSIALLTAADSFAQFPKPSGFPEGPFVTRNLLSARSGELLVRLTSRGRSEIISGFQKKNGHLPSNRQFLKSLARRLGLRISDPLSGKIGKSFRVRGRRINQTKLSKAVAQRFVTKAENNYKLFAFQNTLPGLFGGDSDTFLELGLLWGLNNEGVLGKEDVDIDAPEAWAITTGDSDVVVGVIDTGILLDHLDLTQNLWTNPLEIENGIDDDGNGYIDDLHGWNFVDNVASPNDDHFHGTHVAGTIAAGRNNGRGVAGVAPSVKVIGLKVLNARGEGDTASLVQAIDYAIGLKQRGINIGVLNASLGGGEDSDLVRLALRRANRVGILFVAAAGNNGTDNDAQPIYPASYDLPNVISVAALDESGALAGFSNFGANSVHVGAPGTNIWSSIIFGLYLPFSGTSMAAPHVAGIAALVTSQFPRLSPAQIRDRIMNSVKPLSGLEGTMQVPGIVSAYQSIK